MKNFCLLFSFFILFINIADGQSPTDAGIPEASHVLVVYNSLDQTSVDVKDYYQNARGIPTSNIVPLTLPDSIEITIPNEETHWVGIRQETDIIRDIYNHNTWAVTPTKHAFKYFLDNISTPIRTHLTNNNLISTIRYIVLCKGIPFKIQASGDWADSPGSLTVDGLLCMLNTPDYDSTFILEAVFENNGVPNPYFNVDPNLSMDYRFLPDHFVGNEGQHLSYLVSHLDGISYEVVKGIIDSSLNPDMSGTATWILDADPDWASWKKYFTETRDKLIELGFNAYYDSTDKWITSYTGNVMGYTSHGTHAEDGNCEWEDSAWVKDSLHFNLSNGSVFNTYESFNGNSLTTLNWRYVARDTTCHHTQGLATQFTEIGGTATMGHAWEPGSGIVSNKIFFPAYQLGYNLVDAYYQGLPSLASQNVLVGDPLVRIFNCENTVITSDTTIGSGDYLCNIIIPTNVKLTIKSGETADFRRNAKLKVYGSLELEEGATLNLNAYSELCLGQSSNLIVGQNAQFNFKDHSTFVIENHFVFNNDIPFSFEDDCNFVINGEAELSVNSTFNLVNEMTCRVNGSFILNGESTLNMQNNSSLTSFGTLRLNSESTLNIINTSKFTSNGSFILSEGVILNLQYSNQGDFALSGVIKSLGNVNNNVTINCNSSLHRFVCFNVDTLLMHHTNINSGSFILSISDGIQKERLLSISNCVISSSPFKNLFIVDNTEGVDITLSDNSFSTTNQNNSGLLFSGFKKVQLLRDSIQSTVAPAYMFDAGIYILDNETTEINACYISNFKYGIQRGSPVPEEIEDSEPSYIEDIRVFNCNLDGGQNNSVAAISIGMIENYHLSEVEIDMNNILKSKMGILINNAENFPLEIKNNTITDYELFGISLSNGSESVIKDNILNAKEFTNDNCIGISMNRVNSPSIIGNSITAYNVPNPGSGIVTVSMTDGQIRKNTIQYHKYAIELGSSSPKIGANTITDNAHYGIYISDRSNPDLSASFVGNELYPLSGYNTIRENGLCNQIGYSELYLIKSNISLEKGCNTVADDREEQLSCGYFYLIDGEGVENEIQAQKNYWGEINEYNPEGRFGENIEIDYEGWLSSPCTYGAGGTELILSDSKGTVYDTVYSTGITASGLTDIETSYATANNYYYSNQFTQANQEYEGIIQTYGNNKGSLQAYNRIYTIANLINSTPGEFNQLREFYLQKANNQSDSVIIGTLTHLSDLCLVSAEEYITAINRFDEIAQQNPNTDIALYRQIDALTTSLLIGQDSTMNKGNLVKYRVNDITEYNNKLSELLKTRGKSGLESGEEIMPTEYTLYQNYPNPFNPTTTIKYDLPNASEVSLIIYDILGRKVKELVNTKQQVGRYEIQFNASNLASGIYIYQLVAEKFISSKKMILLK